MFIVIVLASKTDYCRPVFIGPWVISFGRTYGNVIESVIKMLLTDVDFLVPIKTVDEAH